MKPHHLESETQLNELLADEKISHFLIYKHSEVCSVSSSARDELLRYLKHKDALPTYELEVRLQRPLSNLISETSDIRHESPQIILMKNGKKPVWSATHFSITEDSIANACREHLAVGE